MSGLEYIKEDLSQHPQCIHGPTFLMARETAKGLKQFFVCSACRDRKDCSFFLWKDDKESVNTNRAKTTIKEKQIAFASHINHEELYSILKQVRASLEADRSYCFTCNTFLVKASDHELSHNITSGITERQLNFPSTFLKPLENDKIEAQYLFSESAVTQTIDILRELNLTNVLCIGAPRIHEYIQAECSDMKSFLLDIDKRYHNFYGPEKYCWYNMFNNHFFKPETNTYFLDFLKINNGKKTVLVMDPPFGGRLEPISQTINSIEMELKTINCDLKELPILFYFPYFMESHIKNHMPDLKMADYKVNYDNHTLFATGDKARKFGSPVRIFTNIRLSDLKFSGEEYRYCDICERYVYKENNHCFVCMSCTSKDGRTYVHCNECNRCIKPSWVHCKECKKCTQSDHKCGIEQFKQCCFHCHERGHKKSECPKLHTEEIKKKGKRKHNLPIKQKKMKNQN